MGPRKCEKQFGRVIKTLYISNIWKLMNSRAKPAKCYRKVNEFSLESSFLHASPCAHLVLYFLLLELDKKDAKLHLT